MSHPADLRIVPLGPEHRDEVLRLDQAAFAFALAEMDPVADTAQIEWDRTYGAVRPAAGPHRHTTSTRWGDDEELAGVMTTYSLALTVPGRGAATQQAPMAGLSWVSVHPDHRRRGILTALIRHHLHGLHDSGAEAISGLFASEPVIYQRFGYADSGPGVSLTLPRGAALRAIPGTDDVSTQLAVASADRDADLVLEISALAATARPGRLRRQDVVTRSLLVDRPERHRGAEPTQLIVARRGGRATGYAVLRRTMQWQQGVPTGTVDVVELVALDPASEHALWSRVLNLDLMTAIRTPMLGLEDPLLAWLLDLRAAAVTRGDALWLRLVDVDRALVARGYTCDVDLTIALTDDLCPWNAGTWRLRVAGSDVSCQPAGSSDDGGPGADGRAVAADVSMDVRELATAYLGGRSLGSLAAAGLVQEHTAGAVAALSRALRGLTEPGVPAMF